MSRESSNKIKGDFVTEIKSRWDGAVLLSLETESLKLCLGAAVKSRANLQGADLQSANLRGADLQSANLQDANLQGADLRDADLQGADLQSANLRGADLQSANLQGANLRGANLQGADLQSANLQGAKGINANLCTPLRILLDQPGKIRAYKLVNSKHAGPFNGGIVYLEGKSYEVEDANTDETVQCAAGINLATLDWCMKEWKEGYKILIAEFTAEDIAAVPTATDGKFRVKACKIIGEKNLKEIGLPT